MEETMSKSNPLWTDEQEAIYEAMANLAGLLPANVMLDILEKAGEWGNWPGRDQLVAAFHEQLSGREHLSDYALARLDHLRKRAAARRD
jgi:hypothetical protein